MHKPNVEMIALRNAEMPENKDVLTVTRDEYKRQYRKDGQKYIIHPLLTVCLAQPLKYETESYTVCNFRGITGYA